MRRLFGKSQSLFRARHDGTLQEGMVDGTSRVVMHREHVVVAHREDRRSGGFTKRVAFAEVPIDDDAQGQSPLGTGPRSDN